MVSLQKESEWEKKWNDGVRPCAWDEVADFVASAVSNREKEIAEEVKRKIYDQSPDEWSEYADGHDNALKEVLQLLKH